MSGLAQPECAAVRPDGLYSDTQGEVGAALGRADAAIRTLSGRRPPSLSLADLPHALERLSDSHRVLGSQIIDPRFPEIADNPWHPLAEWAKGVVNPANRNQSPDRRPRTKREVPRPR